jgi:hypothetical protein
MPKIQDLGITGTFGDVILYRSNGQVLMRRKGRTGTQAPQAKEQASILGKASGLSARIRKFFSPILPETKSRSLMYRLNNVLQQWMRSQPQQTTTRVDQINGLVGFTLNEANDLGASLFQVMPAYRNNEGSISVVIPAFDSPNPIAPLPFSGNIDIEILAIRCSLHHAEDAQTTTARHTIQYDGTPTQSFSIPLNITAAQEALTVVAVSVNRQAAGIVGAFWN